MSNSGQTSTVPLAKSEAETVDIVGVLEVLGVLGTAGALGEATAETERCCEEGISINTLTPDTLTLVLKHLDIISLAKVERVNRQFRDISQQSKKDVRELDLSYCNQFTDAGLKAIAAKCTQLRSLNLTGCDQITN
eukprot:COSAG01_NODE_6483_length_3639_cov_27.490113_2_plen_136_part_00